MKRNGMRSLLITLLCLAFAGAQRSSTPLLTETIEGVSTAETQFAREWGAAQVSKLLLPPGQDPLPPAGQAAVDDGSSDWQVECALCPKWFGLRTDASLRLDSAGRPHIAYGGNNLYYAWHDGVEWRYTTVGVDENAQDSAILALDSADNPHIAYMDPALSVVKYARWTGSDWTIQVLTSDVSIAGTIGLAIDGNAKPHLTYFNVNGNALHHAYWTGSAWETHIVATDAVYSAYEKEAYNAIALDITDQPVISYYSTSGYLMYARWTGNDWHTEEVVNLVDLFGQFVFAPLSLVTDRSGNPHISFSSQDTGVGYAHWSGDKWVVEWVQSGGEPGGATSLAVDAQGDPHISYTLWNFPPVRYAYKENGVWHSNEVTDMGAGFSLAVGNDGAPHVVYLDTDDSSAPPTLTMAHWSGENWVSEPVDHIVGSIIFLAMAPDSSLTPVISVWDVDRRKTWYLRQTHGKWQTITIGSNGGSSLAVDSQGYPHVVYHGWDPSLGGSVLYARWLGATWDTKRIDGDSADGQNSAIVLDENDSPHIAYFGPPDTGLWYVRPAQSGWNLRSVDPNARVSAALALDSLGRPHLAYCDGRDSSLRYAQWAGAAWNLETVDNSGIACAYVALALDASDQPNISYHDSIAWDLKYAQKVGGAWEAQVVDAWGEGWGTDIAVDAAGQPHIAYIALSDHGVRYAHRTGNNWRIVTVARSGKQSQQVSIFLDAEERPHIAFGSPAPFGSAIHAWLLPALTLAKEAAPNDGIVGGATVTYTLALAGSGLDAQVWDPLPASVAFVPGSVTGTVTPAATYSPTAHAVAWAGVLLTNTVQTIQFQVTAVGVAEPISPTLPIINTAWLTDTAYRRAVTAINIVNGKRVFLPVIVQ